MTQVSYAGTYQDGSLTTENYDLYEIVSQLPDDGIPGSEQYLVVQVLYFTSGEVELKLLKRGVKEKLILHVGSTDAGLGFSLDLLADLLYPAANVEVKKSLVPTGNTGTTDKPERKKGKANG
jgi:hypothetical protein